MTAAEPGFIAVDWGTSRLRASLVGRDGNVLGRMESDRGVQNVPAGGFPAELAAACRPWLEADPELPVLMAGMVGSRNGWVEAPYLHCPCGPADAARQLTQVPGFGRELLLVPGVDDRGAHGTYDVMRGEETQVFGSRVDDGLLCLPGTHSKWVEMRGGRMMRFATFVTGELYAALCASFVARLAEAPDDGVAGAEAAARAGEAGGGLIRLLFQARTGVLGGTLAPQAVRPLISRLLIEAELDGAETLFGGQRKVGLVAAEPQLGPYREALERRGFEVATIDPAAAMLAGFEAIASARRR